jgi:hypothetical protein
MLEPEMEAFVARTAALYPDDAAGTSPGVARMHDAVCGFLHAALRVQSR